jgi:hypothetical protein
MSSMLRVAILRAVAAVAAFGVGAYADERADRQVALSKATKDNRNMDIWPGACYELWCRNAW